jgi:hypothetical protein
MADQRRFPAPWRADKMPGGYVIRDATGQALAFLYSRDTEADARQAKGPHERRGATHRHQHGAAAGAARDGIATEPAGVIGTTDRGLELAFVDGCEQDRRKPAVSRFITNSNLVDCTIGRSRVAPFEEAVETDAFRQRALAHSTGHMATAPDGVLFVLHS